MRFRRIRFENYRCFESGSIEFEERAGDCRNVNLVLGSNGCGKTELLFSFTWALWGYDFKKLRGKEQTPWPLTARLYRGLEAGPIGATERCSVGVEFEEDGIRYRMDHEVTFTKEGAGVKQGPDSYSFSWTNEYGEYEVPLRERSEINAILNKIIPQSTLAGVSFDGERMQRLSQINDDSKATVRSVIDNVTRKAFFDAAEGLFKSLKEDAERTIKRRSITASARGASEQELRDLALQIDEARTLVQGDERKLLVLGERIERLERELEEIAGDLEGVEQSRELMGERRALERQRSVLERQLEEYTKDLRDSMNSSGYLLFCGKLLEDVRGELHESAVPVGLTAPAVQGLLDSGRCICGEDLDERHRRVLEELVKILPPNSINGTLQSHADKVESEARTARVQLAGNMQDMRRTEISLNDNKQSLEDIRHKLEGIDEERVSQLHKQHVKLEAELQRAKEDEDGTRRELDKNREELERLETNFSKISQSSSELDELSARRDFCKKAQDAVGKMRDAQRREALAAINENLKRAYATVSEDARNGRSLWLVQFDKGQMYQMIPFYLENANEVLAREGLSWESASAKDRERAVLSCGESNSTGQSKINTFAFVRAILDFANVDKDPESYQLSRSYPLLIDAPFGDIFDDNLRMSSHELHDFADQVILMLARQSYVTVSDEIGPYVSRCVELTRDEDRGVSIIREATL